MPPISPTKSPLFKGALVTVDDTTSQRNVVAFQYNPDTLTRSLSPQTLGGQEGSRSQIVRFTGAPLQTISLEVKIDAMDQLNVGQAVNGIYPQLAMLELLLYPSSEQVQASQRSLGNGAIEIIPIAAPRTILVWGPRRVVPVRLTSMTVTEQLFDSSLNPIQASVGLELRVLTYSDVVYQNKDYQLFLTYQQNMEKMAARAKSNGASPKLGTNANAL